MTVFCDKNLENNLYFVINRCIKLITPRSFKSYLNYKGDKIFSFEILLFALLFYSCELLDWLRTEGAIFLQSRIFNYFFSFQPP